MGLLKKYQEGGIVGFDPAGISDETKGYSIESLDIGLHLGRTESSAFNSSTYFNAASKALSGNVNTKPKSSGSIKVDDNITIDTRKKGSTWYNYQGDEGYTPAAKKEKIKVGETTVTVTGNYGLRTLTGRTQQHSTGIDLTTSSGKAIALSDGEITKVQLQGSGKKVTTSGTPAAGYYITMKNSDGSHTQYMHLDEMTRDEMEDLVGTKYKRGEELWGYTEGSGSMTGAHVKIRHYGDSSRYNVDPSQLLRGERYAFIPNSKGKNILNLKLGGILKTHY